MYREIIYSVAVQFPPLPRGTVYRVISAKHCLRTEQIRTESCVPTCTMSSCNTNSSSWERRMISLTLSFMVFKMSLAFDNYFSSNKN